MKGNGKEDQKMEQKAMEGTLPRKQIHGLIKP
jgi:hypothetical protein